MKKRLGNFFYNADRAIASLVMGAPAQETISSEVGRIAIGQGKPDGWTPRWKWQGIMAKGLAQWLNNCKPIWGVDHTAKAIRHADALDHADDGKEQ